MERSDAIDCLADAASLHRDGDREGAETAYRAALALDPDQPDAWHGLGCLAHERGEHARAIALIARAVRARPRIAHYRIVLGLALLAEGQAEAARAALSIACLLEPADWRAQTAHGQVLASLGRQDEALAAFDHALAAAPRNPEALHGRAAILLAQGRTEAATDAFRAVHVLRPDDPVTSANLGAALHAAGRPEEADAPLSASLAAAPDRAATWSMRGLARAAIGALDAAIDDLECAHALEPGNAAVARHLAFGRYEHDDRAGARLLLEAILATDPDDHAARLNLGILHLAEGRLEAGWRGYESRHELAPAPPRKWDGRESPELTLVAEQGLGDTLHFLRYAPLAAERAGVVLSLPPSLRRAAASLGLPTVEPGRAGVALGSLPRLFSPDLASIPPPFAAWHDARVAARWSERLRAHRPGARRVGLAWAGSPLYRQDRRRSIDPALLAPLLDVDGVLFVSLQRGASLAGILDPGAELHDLAETAALVAALDLVITVDTAIVHLAAGLGKPTWLLDRMGGDWRWLRGRDDSPWYPSLRIFRQDAPDPPSVAWPPVIARVRDALRFGEFSPLP